MKSNENLRILIDSILIIEFIFVKHLLYLVLKIMFDICNLII